MNICKTLAIALGLTFVASSQALTVLSEGHYDVDVHFHDGELEMSVHDHENETEFEPDEVLFYVGDYARTNRPAGSQFDFIGVASGVQYWQTPEEETPGKLLVGIGAEEIDINDPRWLAFPANDPRLPSGPAKWFRVSLEEATGPGQVSIWNNTDDGPLVWASTSNGLDSNDLFFGEIGSHVDVGWAFTSAGLYTVKLKASILEDTNNNGLLDEDDQFLFSESTSYRFGVEAVPEPATLLTLGGLSALMMRRRRK